MDTKSDSVTGKGPLSSNRRPSGGNNASEVFGFPVSENQFSTLQSELPTVSQRSTEQREEGLVDPRTTRHLRAAAQRTDERRSKTEGADSATVHYRNSQGTVESGSGLNPVLSANSSQFFHSFSASPSDIFLQSVGPVHSLLGTGASDDDALNRMGVKDVACTFQNCNKRISCSGPEWSAGRPGTMPFGARSDACPSPITACLGPYSAASQQLHHTGCNTREETPTMASSTTGRLRDQQSTSQPTATSARRNAADDHASPAEGGPATAQATIFLWRFRRGCPLMDVHRRSLVRCHSGRALNADDVHCVSA